MGNLEKNARRTTEAKNPPNLKFALGTTGGKDYNCLIPPIMGAKLVWEIS